jgi:hypothetical protein
MMNFPDASFYLLEQAEELYRTQGVVLYDEEYLQGCMLNAEFCFDCEQNIELFRMGCKYLLQ